MDIQNEVPSLSPPGSGSHLRSPSSSKKKKKPEAPCPSSPEPNCAICLEKLQNCSVTDSCLHKFCFTCLLEWSKVKPECPLCKSKFASIIHNIRSDNDFEEYTLPIPEPQLPNEDEEGNNRRFIHELHMSLFGQGQFRFNLPSFHLSQHHPASIHPQSTSRPSWRRRRGIASQEFRKNIYEQNLWVDPQSLSDITGRMRECSPEWYRNNPAQTHRLVPWLNRELTVLLANQDPERISFLLNSILEWICSDDILSQGFHRRLYRYLDRHTVHFCHEFYHYARSVYDLIGYDRSAIHIHRQHSSESDGGDDVIFVNEVRTVSENGNISHLDENTPSTSGGETSQGRPPRLVVPVDSSEEEAVEIVGVLPPLGDRIPEIVVLSTDEESSRAMNTILVSSDSDLDVTGNGGARRKRSRKQVSSNSDDAQPSHKSRISKRKKGKGPGKKSCILPQDTRPIPTQESDDSSNPEEEGSAMEASTLSKYRRKKMRRKRKRRSDTIHAPHPLDPSSDSSSQSSPPKKSPRPTLSCT